MAESPRRAESRVASRPKQKRVALDEKAYVISPSMAARRHACLVLWRGHTSADNEWSPGPSPPLTLSRRAATARRRAATTQWHPQQRNCRPSPRLHRPPPHRRRPLPLRRLPPLLNHLQATAPPKVRWSGTVLGRRWAPRCSGRFPPRTCWLHWQVAAVTVSRAFRQCRYSGYPGPGRHGPAASRVPGRAGLK